MRHIEQYVSLIIRTIYRSIAVDDKVTYAVDNPLTGTIDGTLYFQDGSRLEFTEQVSLRARRPVKQVYRYQYIHKKRSIFRYDNAPHYPHLPTFPHHKHVGNKVLATEEPTLKQILAEIADLVAQSSLANR
jgi:hypothetical protein